MATSIPKSTAETAYDLLSEVAALALAEPKRINMNTWRLRAGVDGCEPVRGYPECGTVGCIGGWVDTLRNAPSHAAQNILGLTDEQADELFYDDGLLKEAGNVEDDEDDDVTDSLAQTPEHANNVVAHIRKFQLKYAAQLKAKRV